MNEQAFRALIELVQFDQATHAIKKNIETTHHQLDLLHQEEQKLEQELATQKRIFADARKLVDEKELEAKELDEKESQSKQRLDTAASHREYEALKSEVMQLQAAQHALETHILAAWNELDAAEKSYKEMQKKYDEESARIDAEVITLQEQVQQLTSHVASRATGHDQLATVVPAEWLEKYRAMGSHVSDPIVPILDNACSACFQSLVTQDILRLKRGALLQCKGCFRFLYDQQAMERSWQNN